MRTTLSFFVALFLIAALHCSSADATIYRYKDSQGILHFTNVPNHQGYAPLQEKGSRSNRSRPEFRYDTHISDAAKEYDLDPDLIKAIIKVESNFDKYALSHKGARGLMQLMPETAQDLNVTDAYDPRENIFGGARYFKKLYTLFDGDLRLALASYNAGLEKVRHARAVPDIRETRRYIKRVLNFYQQYQSRH